MRTGMKRSGSGGRALACAFVALAFTCFTVFVAAQPASPPQGNNPDPLKLANKTADPSTLAGRGQVYVKQVSGVSELFYRDSSGNVIQITSGGTVPGSGGTLVTIQQDGVDKVVSATILDFLSSFIIASTTATHATVTTVHASTTAYGIVQLGQASDTSAGLVVQTNDSRLSNARSPTSHATSHENGGSDEISVVGLSGLLADAQTPSAHATSHQDGGSDEISLTGLSGLTADAQKVSVRHDGGAIDSTRQILNFVGSGTTITISDNVASTQADITISASAGATIAGSSGQVAVITGSNAASGTNDFFWNFANGRLGIGTANPTQRLEVLISGAAYPLINDTTSGGSGGLFLGAKNAGGEDSGVFIDHQPVTGQSFGDFRVVTGNTTASGTDGATAIRYNETDDTLAVRGSLVVASVASQRASPTADSFVDFRTTDVNKGICVQSSSAADASDVALFLSPKNGAGTQSNVALSSRSVSGDNSDFRIYMNGSGAASFGTTVFRINPSGQVMIASTTAVGTEKLLVNGDAYVDGKLTVTGVIDPTAMSLSGSSSLAADLVIAHAGASPTMETTSTDSNDIFFRVASSTAQSWAWGFDKSADSFGINRAATNAATLGGYNGFKMDTDGDVSFGGTTADRFAVGGTGRFFSIEAKSASATSATLNLVGDNISTNNSAGLLAFGYDNAGTYRQLGSINGRTSGSATNGQLRFGTNAANTTALIIDQNQRSMFGGITTTFASAVVESQAIDNGTALGLKINATQASVTATDIFVEMYSSTGVEASIAGSAVAGVVAYNTFTGAHYSQSAQSGFEVGEVLVMTGSLMAEGGGGKSLLPTVVRSSARAQKSVYGVFAGIVATRSASCTHTEIVDENNVTHTIHSPKCSEEFAQGDGTLDTINVFGIGSGVVIVTDTNGDLEVGDLLQTSTTAGWAEKQDDGIFRNTTVGKASEAVIWADEPGQAGSKKKLIACTIHSS